MVERIAMRGGDALQSASLQFALGPLPEAAAVGAGDRAARGALEAAMPLVRAIGGTIEAEGEAGIGSRVTVRIPKRRRLDS